MIVRNILLISMILLKVTIFTHLNIQRRDFDFGYVSDTFQICIYIYIFSDIWNKTDEADIYSILKWMLCCLKSKTIQEVLRKKVLNLRPSVLYLNHKAVCIKLYNLRVYMTSSPVDNKLLYKKVHFIWVRHKFLFTNLANIHGLKTSSVRN